MTLYMIYNLRLRSAVISQDEMMLAGPKEEMGRDTDAL